jgi:hypothetical protein
MTSAAHERTRSGRPLLGLRRQPGRLVLALMRLPRPLYNVPEQQFLSEDESVAVVRQFQRRHPWRTRLFAAILGWGDLSSDTAVREFVRSRPFVSFRPAKPAPS